MCVDLNEIGPISLSFPNGLKWVVALSRFSHSTYKVEGNGTFNFGGSRTQGGRYDSQTSPFCWLRMLAATSPLIAD